LADLRGYSYGREDVTAKTLANAYSQALSTIFTTQMKPYEVEILVGQVGERPEENELFHILFDGSVADQKGYVGMGGRSDELNTRLKDAYRDELSLADGLEMAVRTLSEVEERQIHVDTLEAAVLDRTRERRKFRRLSDRDLGEAVPSSA
jgi:proteasome alpha subunit